MQVLFPTSSVLPCNLRPRNSTLLNPNINYVRFHATNCLSSFAANLRANFRIRQHKIFTSSAGNHLSDFLAEESSSEFDLDDQEEADSRDDESPWEGAVIFKRNPSVTHTEYCTTLESLGLGKLSTDISKSRASLMGLRVTKAVKDYPDGTPVLISIDATRKKLKLRLDGIIRTIITLPCNRCGKPAAKSIFSEFSLLLTEEPVKELETINMGIIYGEGKFRASGNTEQEDEDDDNLIDLDDQLYFPPEENEIDISKPIRDMVHVEITIDEPCDPKCKGFCLRCGVNLNRNTCQCRVQEMDRKACGPLGDLRKQMHQR